MQVPVLLLPQAEAMYWLARQMERIECLARVVGVHTALAREVEGRQNWLSILQLYAWLEDYRKAGLPEDADSIITYALISDDNPTSIKQTLRMARENARRLRSRISSEVWNQINRFYSWISTLTPQDLKQDELAGLCAGIRTRVQEHTGVVEGTVMRDAAWVFYTLGRQLERGDQTTRILDTKYHILLPSLSDIGSALDRNQWANLLRSLGAYHAFQQAHHGEKDVFNVGLFLLADETFPRSLARVVREIFDAQHVLRERFGVRVGGEVHEVIDSLIAVVDDMDIKAIVNDGLHEFLDGVQKDLIHLDRALTDACFRDRPPEDPAQSQSQTQPA